ncbi:LuxR C-terminal-related transcriptional regulator [Marinifilum breve]|nr:LuxR C-terminal-related transcriptional regulator [Marinifilum breve]
MKKNIWHRVLLFSILFLLFKSAMAETLDGKNLLLPHVENFQKGDYGGANQNWDAAQAKNGVLYFANSSGLLEYDGESWQLFELPGKQIVRSVAVDSSGKVFVGAHEEFGFWQYNAEGQFEYHSLVHLFESEEIKNQDFWKIRVVGDNVYFQSFASLYVYDYHGIQKTSAPSNIFFFFVLDERILVSLIDGGLFELKNDQLIELKGINRNLRGNISIVLPYSENKLLIGTDLDGLFLYDGSKMEEWSTEVGRLLRKHQLNRGITVDIHNRRLYVVGTITKGVLIFDSNGNLVYQLSKSSGLLNNTVLGVLADKHQNLWISLDKGIANIHLNSPFEYYEDRRGDIGTSYAAAVYSGRLYLGTNHGLFVANWDKDEHQLLSDFEFVKGTEGQVWSLQEIDGQLLCGHNKGTFRISINDIDKISDVSGGWVIKRAGPELLIQGTYIGLAVYKKVNGLWIYSHNISGFTEPTEYLEIDYKGNIWASHAYKGLYRLKVDSKYERVTEVRLFSQQDGLQSDYNINVFEVDEQIVIASGENLLSFNYLTKQLEEFQYLNEQLKEFKASHKIIGSGEGQYWFFKDDKVARVQFKNGKVDKLDASEFLFFKGENLSGYENIKKLDDGYYMVCLDDGFALFKQSMLYDRTKIEEQKVMLREVISTSHLLNARNNIRLDTTPEVPQRMNSLEFKFALPDYRYGNVKYQWKLDGYETFWSPPSISNKVKYNQIPYGTYTFQLRAVDDYGNFSKTIEYTFKILPPWYLSRFAILAYIVLILALWYVLRLFYKRKLERQKEKYFQKLQAENQKHIIKLKNEHLQAEIQNKSKELASYTMLVTKKNELLNDLKLRLKILDEHVVAKNARKELTSINKLIQGNISSEDDWRIFNENFDKANDVFNQILKSRYKDLTPNDLRFCALLRLNMTSKEIASLLNISERSVEVKRYRLRKKLSLNNKQNLVSFLMDLN